MIAPVILFILSLIGLGVVLSVPAWGDFILLAGPSAIASILLVVRAVWLLVLLGPRRKIWLSPVPPGPKEFPIRVKLRPGKPQNWLIIDGSNVMHWKDGTPQIGTLRDVLQQVQTLGFTPGVVFDSNAGHIVAGKYQHHYAMGKLLGLPEDRVMVVDKGTPADPIILAAARDLGARIVTNDRYKDWADQHPEVGTVGHLIKGGYQDGKLWLDLKDPSPQPHVSNA